MTRGRKKDLTIPPTRSLVQQRDYRARKAHYIAELEERCKRAEEENRQLRHELDLARANMSVPFLYNPLATEMSAELLQNLTKASDSLLKFQEFARRHPINRPSSSSTLENIRLPPLQTSLASTSHLPPILPPIPPLIHTSYQYTPEHRRPSSETARKRFSREPSPSASPNEVMESGFTSYPRPPPRRSSMSSESDCCGGYFDCDGFCGGREHNREGGTTPLNSNERTTSRMQSFSPSDSSSAGGI